MCPWIKAVAYEGLLAPLLRVIIVVYLGPFVLVDGMLYLLQTLRR